MKTEIGSIRKKDYKKAIQFAIKGMHFDWYIKSNLALNAYGRYFWYSAINRATKVFAAYTDNRFAGVILAQIKGEPKKYNNPFQKLYVKIFDAIQRTFSKGGAGIYEETTKEQLAHYLKTHAPDGEILFLAADPDRKIRGIGTDLLNALGKEVKGKTLYLYTDDACTYQFYEHRGFERSEEKEIILDTPKGRINLRCFIYSITF